MEKVIVYCENERQGRNFYPAKEGQKVGYRHISEVDKKEKADVYLFACEKPKNKAKK